MTHKETYTSENEMDVLRVLIALFLFEIQDFAWTLRLNSDLQAVFHKDVKNVQTTNTTLERRRFGEDGVLNLNNSGFFEPSEEDTFAKNRTLELQELESLYSNINRTNENAISRNPFDPDSDFFKRLWNFFRPMSDVMTGEEYLCQSESGCQIVEAVKRLKRHVQSLENRNRNGKRKGKSKLGFVISKGAIDTLNKIVIPRPPANLLYACPADYEDQTDSNRIPRTIPVAKCKTYQCDIHDTKEDRHCQEVKIHFPFLRKLDNSNKRYEAVQEEVSVACACTLANTANLENVTPVSLPPRSS